MDNEQITLLEKKLLSCKDIEQLLDEYLENNLGVNLRHRVSSHLKNCDSCNLLFKDYAAVVNLAASLKQESSIPMEVKTRLRETLYREVGHPKQEKKISPADSQINFISN